MGALIPSNLTLVEQQSEVRYSSSRGEYTVRRWRGVVGSVLAQDLALRGQGYETTRRQVSQDVWELEASIGLDATNGSETPVDTWELVATEVEKDMLNIDKDSINGIHPTDKKFLRKMLDGNLTDDQYENEPLWFSDGTIRPQALYQLILSGVKSASVYAPTLKHTKSVSRSYEIPNSLLYVGEVISSAKMLEYETIPTSISSQFPTSGYVTKGAISNLLYKGWLKTFPAITIAAYNKTQIVQEWRWGLWAADLYTIRA